MKARPTYYSLKELAQLLYPGDIKRQEAAYQHLLSGARRGEIAGVKKEKGARFTVTFDGAIKFLRTVKGRKHDFRDHVREDEL
jgi:hypothetical protein